MSAIYKERQPSLASWTTSSVQASLSLDTDVHHLYTNLDVISGKVVVRCTKDISVNAIVVKLEGESRTRLLGQTSEERRQEPDVQTELHKILYKIQTVFPPAEVAETRVYDGKGSFTIPAGTHEYLWSFKLPFNNACYTPPSTLVPGVQMGMSARGFAMNRIPARHVKTTLPPTLRGFPGEAEISYFVKATVQRQGLFKENARSRTPFQFIPIEPPRPALTGELSFARQQHTFYHNSKRAGKKSIFSFTTPTQEQGPSFSFDMRLPEPAILTCNQPLPLSIVFTKLNTSTGVVYLQSLQISLIAFTKIRTHDLERTESSSWIIMSKSNLGTTAINGRDPEGHQLVLDDTSWKHSPLPNTVAPSFATCNISRSYQVEVRASFSYGGATFDGLKPQHIVLSLRLNASIYSGIAPPKAALDRLLVQNTSSEPQSQSGNSSVMQDGHNAMGKVEGVHMSAQEDALGNTTGEAPALPLRPGEEFVDAPPSYEDAIASELPPIDGYRPAYAPPPAGEDRLLNRDEKRGWLG